MAAENQENLDSLVAAIRRESAQLPNLEDVLFLTKAASIQKSGTDLDTAVSTAMRAAEHLATPRLVARPKTGNFLTKVFRKLVLTVLDRIERRRCQAELALLQAIQNLHSAQRNMQMNLQELQNELQIICDETDQTLVRQFQYLQRQIDSQNPAAALNPELEKLIEQFYCRFEAEYRGSSDSVRHRLRPYRDRLQESKKLLDIVDLGCGRGEWLSLMRDLGHRVQGVDCNPEFIELCQKQNLNVELADAGAWLHDQSDNSVDVVSAFHVIEHLSFSSLTSWLQQIYRILRPKGWLLLETPNISQFHVGLVDFYRDPTHIQKIHPQMLKTLLETMHFADVETAYVNAHGHEIQWLPTDQIYLQDPGQYGALPADLAIIARKKAES